MNDPSIANCESTPFVTFCVNLSHLLVCFNSSANFVIYLLGGEKFRRAWCQTYLCRKADSSHTRFVHLILCISIRQLQLECPQNWKFMQIMAIRVVEFSNGGVNFFVIYLLGGEKFRRAWCQTYLCRKADSSHTRFVHFFVSQLASKFEVYANRKSVH